MSYFVIISIVCPPQRIGGLNGRFFVFTGCGSLDLTNQYSFLGLSSLFHLSTAHLYFCVPITCCRDSVVV